MVPPCGLSGHGHWAGTCARSMDSRGDMGSGYAQGRARRSPPDAPTHANGEQQFGQGQRPAGQSTCRRSTRMPLT